MIRNLSPRVGPGHPSFLPLSIYFLIFSPFYFSFSFIGFTYFLLLSVRSLSTTIVPLHFQAGGRIGSDRTVIWPVKTVLDMTYDVFVETLNLTQSINQSINQSYWYKCLAFVSTNSASQFPFERAKWTVIDLFVNLTLSLVAIATPSVIRPSRCSGLTCLKPTERNRIVFYTGHPRQSVVRMKQIIRHYTLVHNFDKCWTIFKGCVLL